MLYSVNQISESTGSSKQNIYKKLQKKELKEHIVKKEGINYLDEEGYNLFKASFKTTTEDIPLNEYTASDTTDSSMNENMFNLMKEQLKEKDRQIQEKDNQINDYSERLKQSLELNRNSQVLLKEKPHQDILQLEEHFNDLDDKLIDIKDKMLERKVQNEKTSFFSKFFKGND